LARLIYAASRRQPGEKLVRGQAVLIELGARGVLIAALAGENYDYSTNAASDLFGRAYNPHRRAGSTGYPLSIENERALSEKQGPVALTPDNMPAFFWFSDPTNLDTVKLVKPANFASVIGDTTQLVSAQVEITNDPIVIDIDKKLPAYVALREPPINGNDYVVPGGLHVGWRLFISRGRE
jgi:hypothetical protein